MITQAEVLSSLLYLAVTYPAIVFLFRDESANRRKCLWSALSFAVAALAVKLGYEIYGAGSEPNFYASLEVSRHSSVLEIRQAYKKVSKKLHPDKNPSPDAEAKFQQVKTAYDVLMDEQQRDIYNRFGKESLSFDPRLDELKLLSSVAVAYLFWAVCIFVYTIPVASRASRTWLTIVGIACLILEVTLCLTETALPSWMPATMTEQELIRKVHSVFPAFIAGFASLATSLYVDIDKTCIAALAELTQHQKALSGVLHQLQVVVSAAGDKNKPADSLSVEQISAKMAELREIMDQSGETTVQIVEKLKNSSSNPGSSYYWLIFLVIYGGVYLFQ